MSFRVINMHADLMTLARFNIFYYQDYFGNPKSKKMFTKIYSRGMYNSVSRWFVLKVHSDFRVHGLKKTQS